MNKQTALKWYALAAEQGDADAQFNLGVMYHQGQGVLENDETAVKWYTLAAQQGLAEAQANLGVMYQHGNGIPKDIDRAYMWFNIGAYGGSDFGARNKQALDKKMNSAKRTRLQELSNNCLASGYKDC